MDKIMSGLLVGMILGAGCVFTVVVLSGNVHPGTGELLEVCEAPLPRDETCVLVAVVGEDS